MSGPKNDYYVVAINMDGSYPLRRDSHVKHGQPHPEVQNGYLTTGHVIPDGQIIPYVNLSLYESGRLWIDIADMTWQEVNDMFKW